MNIKDGDRIILIENGIDKAGRIWSASDIIKNFKDEIYGEMGISERFGPGVNLNDVSHKFVDFEIENLTVSAVIKILETPMGKVLSSIANLGCEFETNISSIGYVEENKMREPVITSINLVSLHL